jgi:hypothetical protein
MPKVALVRYFDYKWTWWLYNESNFIQGEMKQRYGVLIHFYNLSVSWVNEIDLLFVVMLTSKLEIIL